jgi:hypothetical protein
MKDADFKFPRVFSHGGEKALTLLTSHHWEKPRTTRSLFIAQGKTARVEDTQIGNVDGHWRTYRGNGWQTAEAFCSISTFCGITLEEEETPRIAFI